ncbi:hypothetical protein DAHU10_021110 [Hanseniaspora uvarum]|nr:hypothetical protein DAHU10_021110 [Hanseniaspora uvarum]
MVNGIYIWMGVIGIFTFISSGFEIKEDTSILDLPDPFKKNHFQFINTLEDLDTEKYSLKYSNYSITKEYNNCSIYEFESNEITINQDILDDTLAKALEIIERVANTEQFEALNIMNKIEPDPKKFHLIDTVSSYVYVNFIKFFSAIDNAIKETPVNAFVRRLTYVSQLFWNYEIDLKVQIKQTANYLPSYVLGKSSNIKGSILDDQTAKLKYHIDGYYVSLTYGNGDLCQVTGLHRETELQFVCDKNFFDINNVLFPSEHDSLEYEKIAARTLSVTEPYICNYQVLIGVPSLCELELFSNKNSLVSSKQDGKLHDYKVFCESPEENFINTNAEPELKSLFDDNFQSYHLGKKFVIMKHQSPNISDYLVYTDIVDSSDDIDFSVFDFAVLDYIQSHDNSVFIMRLGNTYPGKFNLNKKMNEYTFYIEVFDLVGKYIATLQGQGFDNYKVINTRISELQPIKNWVPNLDSMLPEISEDETYGEQS